MSHIVSSSDGVIRPKLCSKSDMDVLHSRVFAKDVEAMVESVKERVATVPAYRVDEAYEKRCAEIRANLEQTLKRKLGK